MKQHPVSPAAHPTRKGQAADPARRIPRGWLRQISTHLSSHTLTLSQAKELVNTVVDCAAKVSLCVALCNRIHESEKVATFLPLVFPQHREHQQYRNNVLKRTGTLFFFDFFNPYGSHVADMETEEGRFLLGVLKTAMETPVEGHNTLRVNEIRLGGEDCDTLEELAGCRQGLGSFRISRDHSATSALEEAEIQPILDAIFEATQCPCAMTGESFEAEAAAKAVPLSKAPTNPQKASNRFLLYFSRNSTTRGDRAAAQFLQETASSEVLAVLAELRTEMKRRCLLPEDLHRAGDADRNNYLTQQEFAEAVTEPPAPCGLTGCQQ